MVTTRSGRGAESDGAENRGPETHLITGGAGYPGMRLALGLRDHGHLVRLFDWMEPTEPLPEGITFVKVSVDVE